MNYQADDDYDDGEDSGQKKKQPWLWRIFKWIVCALAAFIVAAVIYRSTSTNTPSELKNYLINSERIEKTYTQLKDDFKIYKIEVRNAFSNGDAFFVDSAYYLESAETLQAMLRCKTGRLRDVFDAFSGNGSAAPLKVYLKLSEIGDDEAGAAIYVQPANESAFGKNKDAYRYFVYSFEDIKIDDAKTKIEMYVFENIPEAAEFDEEAYIARFTLLDVNMPKTKMKMNKFKFSNQ